MHHNPLGPIEPHADLRQAANFWFQTYAACVSAGFHPDQAMDILTTLIDANIHANTDDD